LPIFYLVPTGMRHTRADIQQVDYECLLCRLSIFTWSSLYIDAMLAAATINTVHNTFPTHLSDFLCFIFSLYFVLSPRYSYFYFFFKYLGSLYFVFCVYSLFHSNVIILQSSTLP
jgi:hypothetical protein